MPHRPSAAGRIALVALLCLGLLACERGTPGHGAPIGVVAKPPAQAARKPVDAVNVLRDRLLARDGAGFARLSVPPALHAELVQGWQQGHSRWPLDELPLDAKIPKMLASLQEKNAESKLMATFRRQFAGADRDIDQAIRTLVLFGGEYVQKEADYTPEEREHVAQALVAVGDWARAAPLSIDSIDCNAFSPSSSNSGSPARTCGRIFTTSMRVIRLRTSDGLSHSPEQSVWRRPASMPAFAKSGQPGFCLNEPTARTANSGDAAVAISPPIFAPRPDDASRALNHSMMPMVAAEAVSTSLR